MPPQKPKPPALAARMALPDVELRETLDLLGKVVASMSARIDRQGEQIAAMAAIVEETRAAACRTEQQTNPAAYGRFIGSEVEKALDAVLDEFASVVLTIRKDHETTAARLKELEQAEEAALERLRQDLDEAPGWRRRVPWVWAGSVSAGITLTVILSALF